MGLRALVREIKSIGDKDRHMDITALRLAAMIAYASYHKRHGTSAYKKAVKIYAHALSEQTTLKSE